MHCTYFYGRIYVELTSEQYFLGDHNSEKAEEKFWWDKYSNDGLDDEQVYGEDNSRGLYNGKYLP